MAAEPDGRRACVAVVDKPRRHLLQLGRYRRCVLRYDLVFAKTHDIVPLHSFVWRAVIQRDPHLGDMAWRQLVLVLARLQHKCRGADAGHDLFKRTGCWNPLAKVAVGADEILLQERTLGTAQQLLIDYLALTEDILKPVRRERSCQPPAYLHCRHDFLQRLIAFAAGVLQPRQFVKHNPVEAG